MAFLFAGLRAAADAQAEAENILARVRKTEQLSIIRSLINTEPMSAFGHMEMMIMGGPAGTKPSTCELLLLREILTKICIKAYPFLLEVKTRQTQILHGPKIDALFAIFEKMKYLTTAMEGFEFQGHESDLMLHCERIVGAFLHTLRDSTNFWKLRFITIRMLSGQDKLEDSDVTHLVEEIMRRFGHMSYINTDSSRHEFHILFENFTGACGIVCAKQFTVDGSMYEATYSSWGTSDWLRETMETDRLKRSYTMAFGKLGDKSDEDKQESEHQQDAAVNDGREQIALDGLLNEVLTTRLQ